MSNLSNIGYRVKTNEELEKLIIEITKSDNFSDLKILEENGGGNYRVYPDSSGSEIYFQIDKNNHWQGLNPHFNGKSKFKIEFQQKVEDKNHSFDGIWLVDVIWEYTSPLCIFVPDYLAQETPKEKPAFIQLAAFARHIEIFESEEEFNKANTRISSRSLIPSGLFDLDSNEPKEPEPEAVFTGVIKEVREKVNSLTNEKFVWMLVGTLGGEVDVVADKEIIEHNPKAGGVIMGNFYLSGRPIE